MKNAFTMVELIFVIVIIGILSVVAIPKFEGVATAAHESKAQSTVASIRSTLATERQKRILRGKFSKIVSLDSAAVGTGASIFNDMIDEDDIATGVPVFDYSMNSCESGQTAACWSYNNGEKKYTYYFPDGSSVYFNVTNGKFVCSGNAAKCKILTQ